MNRKIVYGILLALVVIAILLLTFQDAAGTIELSETFRLWFEKGPVELTVTSNRQFTYCHTKYGSQNARKHNM